MHGSKVTAVCIFNHAASGCRGLFLAFDGASTYVQSLYQRNKLLSSSVMKAYILCLSSGYECIPIRAHVQLHSVCPRAIKYGLYHMRKY